MGTYFILLNHLFRCVPSSSGKRRSLTQRLIVALNIRETANPDGRKTLMVVRSGWKSPVPVNKTNTTIVKMYRNSKSSRFLIMTAKTCQNNNVLMSQGRSALMNLTKLQDRYVKTFT